MNDEQIIDIKRFLCAQLVDALFFLLLLAVFLFAFGITAQALLYPNSEPSWEVLKNVVFHPYFDIFGSNNLDELQGITASNLLRKFIYEEIACSKHICIEIW